ncbi:MAG: VCBS repeat-containing protein [Pyrinomonadaceae bacterium]|nr:VCBS repeat-containing protein [Pyrinomonadaceae bacterium]
MRATAIVRRKVFNRQKARKLFASGLVVILSLTMAVPAWATVFTNSATITINDAATVGVANPYPSTINVSGLTGNVTNITVTFNNFNHTFPDDMDILLVGPTGANLVLMSDAGGSNDLTNGGLTFDDAAPATITDGGPLGSGIYKPSQFVAGDTYPAPAPAASANTTLAAAFNGTDPNGTWSLYAVDDTGVDQGVIGNGWYLTITTDSSPATAFTNATPLFMNDRFAKASPFPSTITVSGLTGAITDVNVTLTNISHLNPDDLDILLISPSGKSLMIMSDSGGTTDLVNVTITLDDAAASALPDSTVIATGSFRPANFGSGDNIADILPFYPNAGTAGPATLATSFNGLDPNGTWSLYVIDDATASTGNIAGGWSLDITAGGAYNAKRYTVSDFNGDGKTDVAQFRAGDRNWYIRNSNDYSNRVQVDWGNTDLGDVLVPGDYDGDRKTDIAVWRETEGNWYIINSSTGLPSLTNWGQTGDVPVPADYDGDGKTDIAVWRGAEGNWYVRNSTGSNSVSNWGQSGDIPVPGHYGGSATAIRAVYRPSENNWYLNTSPVFIVNWGAPGDILVPGDYDANGATDFAVWRPSEGRWYVRDSTSGAVTIRVWGLATDIPVPGDYDGDCRTDFAIWRPDDGNWFILNSGTTPNAQRIDYQGQSGDSPIPAAYVQQ